MINFFHMRLRFLGTTTTSWFFFWNPRPLLLYMEESESVLQGCKKIETMGHWTVYFATSILKYIKQWFQISYIHMYIQITFIFTIWEIYPILYDILKLKVTESLYFNVNNSKYSQICGIFDIFCRHPNIKNSFHV